MSEVVSPPARRRWPWAVMLLLVIALASIAGLYWYWTHPDRISALAVEALEQMTGAKAHVSEAHFDAEGKITLSGVRLDVSDAPADAQAFFTAEQITLWLNSKALWRGQVDITSVVADKPTIFLTEMEDSRYTMQLLPVRTSDEPPGQMPRIEVRGGVVRCGQVVNGAYNLLGSVPLNGAFSPDLNVPGDYRFELEQPVGPEGPVAIRLTGRFDADRRTLEAQLSQLVLDGPHSHLLPKNIRQFWAQHHPAGTLKDIRFDYEPEQGAVIRGAIDHGQITLLLPRDAGLNEKVNADVSQRYPTRMTDVSGHFVFGTQAIDAEFSGLIEGLRYQVKGHGDGYDALVSPFRLELKTDPFIITDRPKYFDALPPAAKLFLRAMKPKGRLKLATVVHRDQPGGEVIYDGRVEVMDGAFTYDQFPYKLTDIRAEVVYDAKVGARIEHLVGHGPSGGKIFVTGGFQTDGQVQVDIVAKSIPIDNHLRMALNPYSRASLDEFFDREAWAALRQAGHFVSSADRAAEQQRRVALESQIKDAQQNDPNRLDALRLKLALLAQDMKRPVFDMGGVCDIHFSIRKTKDQERPVMTTRVDLLKASGIYEGFVYPLRVQKGRLVLRSDYSLFQDIHATGLLGGKLHMDGRIELKTVGHKVQPYPKLRLTGQKLPVNSLLFDVLGPARSKSLRQMRLGGQLNLDGLIHRDPGPGTRTEVDIGLVLSEGSARPGGGNFVIRNLNGKAHMTLDGMVLKHLEGERAFGEKGLGHITLKGEMGWSKQNVHAKLHLTGEALFFEDQLMDLISADKELRAFWKKHQATGPFDADIKLELQADQLTDYALKLHPKSLGFMHEDGQIQINQTQGAIHIHPNRVVMNQFRGVFSDGGTFDVDGQVDLGKAGGADLKLALQGASITDSVRRLMPEGVRASIDEIKLKGDYRLVLDPLTCRQTPKDLKYRAKGNLVLKNASLKLGIPVQAFFGSVQMNLADQSEAQTMALKVDAQKMLIEDQPIQMATLEIHREKEGRLIWKMPRGSLYGGTLSGHGAMDQNGGAFYAELMLADAPLAEMVKANQDKQVDDQKTKATSNKEKPVTGTMSATLVLQGGLGKAPDRGRGVILVRDTQLTGVPLVVGMAQLSHLNLPVIEHFDRVAIGYRLDEDKIIFDKIRLTSPTMTLAGGGTMDRHTGALDIRLTTKSPKGLDFGPLTQVIDLGRDQLFAIHIGGTLKKPDVDLEKFSTLRKVWEDVFSPTQARRQREPISLDGG